MCAFMPSFVWQEDPTSSIAGDKYNRHPSQAKLTEHIANNPRVCVWYGLLVLAIGSGDPLRKMVIGKLRDIIQEALVWLIRIPPTADQDQGQRIQTRQCCNS